MSVRLDSNQRRLGSEPSTLAWLSYALLGLREGIEPPLPRYDGGMRPTSSEPGAPGRIRTVDLRLTKSALFRLSYGGRRQGSCPAAKRSIGPPYCIFEAAERKRTAEPELTRPGPRLGTAACRDPGGIRTRVYRFAAGRLASWPPGQAVSRRACSPARRHLTLTRAASCETVEPPAGLEPAPSPLRRRLL
ncbi:hypothetical protein LCGC14_2784790 [marine sediment metagenome]|uniref:Uncharacterized protein n=1 Tax=marine sediment metagenome TaxID=412755 RepID=A0A0F8YS84_9ZZZZ